MMDDSFLQELVAKLRVHAEQEESREIPAYAQEFREFADEQRQLDEREAEAVPEGYVDRGELPPVPAENFALSNAGDVPSMDAPLGSLDPVPTVTSTPPSRSRVTSVTPGGLPDVGSVTESMREVVEPGIAAMQHTLAMRFDDMHNEMLLDLDRRGATL